MPNKRKPFVPHFTQPLSSEQIQKEAQRVVACLSEEGPIPMRLVPFNLVDCCDKVLLGSSIGTRWQHGGIATSTGVWNFLDVIVNCVKDEARKLRIYSELDDVLVNKSLNAWKARVAAGLLQSRGETAREETPSDSSAEPEQVGDEKDTVKALDSFIFDLLSLA